MSTSSVEAPTAGILDYITVSRLLLVPVAKGL